MSHETVQLPSPQLIHNTKECIRKVNAMGGAMGGANYSRTTFYHGLLTGDLIAPTWGDSNNVELQVWEKNDNNLEARTPIDNTITVTNYDPALSLDKGTYVIVQYILGDFIVVWASCWSDPSKLAT